MAQGEGKDLHESASALGAEAMDRHRAILSLQEELEATDWYDQRAQATEDDELRALLIHNRNEEMEHAAMLLEWLRRTHPELDAQLRTYLFRDGSIIGGEPSAQSEPPGHDGSLGIGSLRGGGE